MRLKPAGKMIIFLLVAGLAVMLWRLFGSKLVPDATNKQANVPIAAPLPQQGNVEGAVHGAGADAPIPTSTPAAAGKPEVRMLVWAWNAQMGAMFANGGPQTTEGSLMSKHGVNLHLMRQDDVSKMQEELQAFATELSQGSANPGKGAHFVAIMGDGSPAFLKALNDKLKRIGPEYTARVVGTIGYSRGEDKFMGLPVWKANPAASRGGLVAGYLRDGDWNIAMKWLADNGLKNNPDEKTYDPDALNWVAANDYLDAAEKYISGFSEDRPVVHNGKRTGETKHVTVNGVVTWTPGDVNVATKKGGLVSIASTKEYNTQMPCTIIGINKWMRANHSAVENMLQAFLEGGEAVKANPAALTHAAGISAAVYKEQNAAYWEKYYRGTTEKDAQGQEVELGGSAVSGLTDALLTFGMLPGSANLFAATYKVFGDIAVQQYPELMPDYPSLAEVLDTSYMAALKERGGVVKAPPVKPSSVPKAPSKPGSLISERDWNIPFDSGRASFSPGAQRELEKLRRELLVAGGTTIELHGHTDNVGNSDGNKKLSEQRAFAVKGWLDKKAKFNFAGRIKTFAHGDSEPLVPNDTPTGRAKNRRVQVVLRRVGM